ncbi:2-hydroxychromene-2-carboxylate isomerase [Exilibacterium tricleocarpae]|uniref:2-hydroxychromene-2-carboxylate isomerase n=1 Tax=Exilibacterium tricleocarpae TaxID=2591008 RepID=A0A545TZQ5_9GAMM|nr:2-hydroxychromene-2-carboxylate isomerase [Exilibacterium tricleocarpae]TQV82694.1 2-hydroxychromene-2-carboxylate isomerase [Exilibacterium tricleocarpae]
MSVNLDFYFDFASPNAYFAYMAASQIEARTGVPFNYIPVLLGGIFKATNNQPPMMAFADVKNKLDYERIEIERFITRYKLTAFTFNSHFPVNTLQVMRGATAALIDGILPAYMEAVFRHMWEESRKMDDPETILTALNEAGLDGEQLVQRMQDAEVKQALKDNTAAAVERGAFGIPTFFVNDEIYFGKDRLRDVEERVLSLQAAS